MKKFFFFWVVFQISFSLFSMPAEVEDLTNQKYFPALLKEIESAKKSIYVCMYYISYFPKKEDRVFEILKALRDAAKRGVAVEVLLDQGYAGEKSTEMRNKNLRAYAFLREAGISVFYDEKKTITHAKYFVVDESVVIVGSFNLSQSALSLNNEAGVLIRSREMAQVYLANYRAIPKFAPEPLKEGVPIPKTFLLDKNLGHKMFAGASHRIMEFYLLCQKLSFEQKSRVIKISEAVIEEVFFKGSNPVVRDRGILEYFSTNVLRKNKGRFGFLVSYEIIKDSRELKVVLDAENKGAEDSLWLSELYWKDGWFLRLGSEAKIFLLYVILKTDSGRLGRSVWISQPDMAKDFKFSFSSMSIGSTELQRFNLIEKEINTRNLDRVPNHYILNDFYFYGDFEKELQKIKEATDPALFEVSQKLCWEVLEDHDLECLKKVIGVGREYGVLVLQAVYEKISKAEGNSAYRRFNYMVSAIKYEAEKNRNPAVKQ